MNDSTRWDGFAFREGDIIISVPPKCGTTWMQMLCSLLVFDGSEPPRPLNELSPWFDLVPNDPATVTALLDAQEHRRFIKTHTPLDGLPRDERVTYVCVGRDPRDAFLSSLNNVWNMNPDAVAFIEAIAGDSGSGIPDMSRDLAELFRDWVDRPFTPEDPLVGLCLDEIVHHVRTFWEHRDEPRIGLFHYNDLLVDLPGQLRGLAKLLSIDLGDERIADLAAAATFDRMRQRADDVTPQADMNFWQRNEAFFHSGSTGQWQGLFSDEDLQHYDQRLASLAPADLASWLHTGWLGALSS